MSPSAAPPQAGASGEGAPPRPLAERVFFLALLAVSLVAWGAFLFAIYHRVPDSLELGGGEGLQMDHVLRVARLQPLYVEPSFRFVPLIYMPLYYVVVAPLVHGFGAHFWVGRLVNLLSALGVALLIARIVSHETRLRLLGFAASGIYLMGHGFTKGYDTVRPDTLMMVIALGGLTVLRMGSGARSAVVAGLLLSLAFFTKQNAICFGLAALWHLLLSDRKRLFPYAAAYVLATAGGCFVLSRWLGPWFSFYVYDVPRHWVHFSQARVIDFVGRRLFMLGVLTVSSLLACALPESPWRGRSGLWFWAALGGAGMSMMSTFDPYAYDHVFMPTIVMLAVLGTISLAGLVRHLPAPARGPDLRLATGYAVLALQFVPMLYPVRTTYHHHDTRRVHENLMARLQAYRTVMVPYHGFFADQAGLRGSLCVLPLDDIVRGTGNRLLRRDPQFFDRMFDQLRHGPGRPVLITDLPLERLGDVSQPYWASLAPHYRLVDDLGAFGDSLRPLLPGATTMHLVYAPVEEPPAAEPGAARAPATAGAPRAAALATDP